VNGSRGGIYSVLLLFLLFIPFYIYEKWINDKKTRVLLHLVAIMIVFSIGFYILQKFSYQELVEFLGSSGDYGSDLYRVRLIMGGVKAFIQSAFLGIGPGQSIAINSMNIHNFYFEILAEYGIFIGIDRHNPPYINALFKATAVALILASVSSSSTVKMRAYWVFIILILIIKKKNILQESNDMQ
jgi:O-antigen ligase